MDCCVRLNLTLDRDSLAPTIPGQSADPPSWISPRRRFILGRISRTRSRPSMPHSNTTLTTLAGVQVGHAQDLKHRTGTTVVLLKPPAMAFAGIRGGSAG